VSEDMLQIRNLQG